MGIIAAKNSAAQPSAKIPMVDPNGTKKMALVNKLLTIKEMIKRFLRPNLTDNQGVASAPKIDTTRRLIK